MTGCPTCGGFGERHDPIAHGATRYQSHTWDPGVDDDCIVCGVTWSECDDVCPGPVDPFTPGTRVEVHEVPGGYVVFLAPESDCGA